MAEQIQRQRAQQMQAAQGMEQMNQASQAAKNLGSTPMGESDALTALLGGPAQ